VFQKYGSKPIEIDGVIKAKITISFLQAIHA